MIRIIAKDDCNNDNTKSFVVKTHYNNRLNELKIILNMNLYCTRISKLVIRNDFKFHISLQIFQSFSGKFVSHILKTDSVDGKKLVTFL